MNFQKEIATPITVLMTSTSYPQGPEDWRGVFIRQLLIALDDCPQLRMHYWGPPGQIPECTNYSCIPAEAAWLTWMMDMGGIIHLLRQKGLGRFSAALKLLFLLKRAYKRQNNVSLFHVNWLQNALPLLGTTQPALVSILGSDFGLLKVPGMTTLLRQVLKKRRCILAPNAEWMKDELEERFGDIAEIVPIPLGINNYWFAIKREGISLEKCKWLVVSRLTHKKIGPLFDWGRNIFTNNAKHELHLFGPMQEQIKIPDWVHYHGSTHPQALCETWFPQATGLITLSQHDEGRPQVMLEAMAAGLPIIASDLPAHRNFIGDKQTGILVRSQEEYCQAIEWLSDATNNQKIAEAAKQWVKHEIGTWSDCALRYIKVYKMLLNENK